MNEKQETFKSSDMALVVFLKQNGHSAQSCVWSSEHGTVYWTFLMIPSLVALVEMFGSGEARVEPREYNRLFQMTKREMYSEADPHRQ